MQLRQRVKCVTDVNGYALYFSRGMLPHNKEGAPRPFPSPFQDKPYLLHLGLQCYDRHFLSKYCVMPPTPLMVRPPPLPQLSRPFLLPRSACHYACVRSLVRCSVAQSLRGQLSLIAGSLHPCRNAGVHQVDAVLLVSKWRKHRWTTEILHAILKCCHESELI